MKLWLVCFLLLFFSAEGLQWLGQLHWPSSPELTQPWVILAGIGLAVASNASRWPTWPAMTDGTSRQASQAPHPTPIQIQTVAAVTDQVPALRSTQGKSISFEIRKPG